ncbi:MAG: TIR domain-containing protein [Candidatus Thiodiazotropha endolucinida]|nr:TIR domain-containing protein [Candidatus Thiodiazotropha taylori]MCW4314841.1 TIR domain-containing protein [Candidatus Thiodiazotropha taylori]
MTWKYKDIDYVGIAYLVIGIIYVFGGFLLVLGPLSDIDAFGITKNDILFGGFLLFFLSVLHILAGIGLLKRHSWAWYVSFVLAVMQVWGFPIYTIIYGIFIYTLLKRRSVYLSRYGSGTQNGILDNQKNPAQQNSKKSNHNNKRYDVALSFAGEDRKHAREIANLLISSGYSVFYDEYEKAGLWGRNLYTHLSDVYKNKAVYCLMFISNNYAKKAWTKREQEAAQSKAFELGREYILPLKLDDTELPGIDKTVAYVDLREFSYKDVVDLISEKLKQTDAI